MTNKDLINGISAQTGMTKRRAGELLDLTMGVIIDELVAGKQVQISDFGTFEVRKKNERISVNPVTKVRLLIPPKQQLAFKQSSVLKEKLNER